MIDSLAYVDKENLAYLLKKLTLAYKKVYKTNKTGFLQKLQHIESELKLMNQNQESVMNLKKKLAFLKQKIQNLKD